MPGEDTLPEPEAQVLGSFKAELVLPSPLLSKPWPLPGPGLEPLYNYLSAPGTHPFSMPMFTNEETKAPKKVR